jgi:hypothetical protein
VRSTTIAGCFTAAAQSHNAENLLMPEDRALAAQYQANWDLVHALGRPQLAQAALEGVAGERPGLLGWSGSQ